MKPKYKTYAELAAAMKSGELDDGYYLRMDKSGTELRLCWHKPDASDEERDRRNDACRELFDQGRNLPIEQMLTESGIRWQWC